jgi:hypothetical protein
MDILSWIIGTAFLWGTVYVLVNPATRYFAKSRLRSRSPTVTHGKKNEIDAKSIPARYFMFSGALIFTLLGFLIGSIFGIYFIGLSWEKKHLPSVATLILSSLGGSFLNSHAGDIAFSLLDIAFLITIVTGASVGLQSPKMLRWKEETLATQTASVSSVGEGAILENLLGGFEVVEPRVFSAKSLGLFFTPSRILVARIGNKKFEELRKLSPQEILTADKENFTIPYDGVTLVLMRKTILRSTIKIRMGSKEFGPYVFRKEDFNGRLSIVRSVLSGKVPIET